MDYGEVLKNTVKLQGFKRMIASKNWRLEGTPNNEGPMEFSVCLIGKDHRMSGLVYACFYWGELEY